MGWYRPVHRKSPDAQEARALLAGRKLLQAKLRDVELSIRGILRGFGLKVGEVSKGRFAARIGELIAGHEMLEAVIGAMLQAREGLRAEFARLHRRMLAIVRGDAVCRRPMTVPGVGALVALLSRRDRQERRQRADTRHRHRPAGGPASPRTMASIRRCRRALAQPWRLGAPIHRRPAVSWPAISSPILAANQP